MSVRKRDRSWRLPPERSLFTRSEIYGALVLGFLIVVFLLWSWWTR